MNEPNNNEEKKSAEVFSIRTETVVCLTLEERMPDVVRLGFSDEEIDQMADTLHKKLIEMASEQRKDPAILINILYEKFGARVLVLYAIGGLTAQLNRICNPMQGLMDVLMEGLGKKEEGE